MLINQFLLLGAALFSLGVYGVLTRKNAVLVLLSVELMLAAVNINLVAFDRYVADAQAAGGFIGLVAVGPANRCMGSKTMRCPAPPSAIGKASETINLTPEPTLRRRGAARWGCGAAQVRLPLPSWLARGPAECVSLAPCQTVLCQRF